MGQGATWPLLTEAALQVPALLPTPRHNLHPTYVPWQAWSVTALVTQLAQLWTMAVLKKQ